MATVNYGTLARNIIETVGGESNVASATHCATRLRLVLKDESKANKAATEKLPGVITVMTAGGQYQVVIGNNVGLVYEELGKFTKLTEGADAANAPKGNFLNQTIALISSIFSPTLWPLAGSGLLKAFLSLLTNFNLIDTKGSTYTILYAASDALFYFLPLFLAVTAAKRFKTNQFTSMAVAGALIYPTVVALSSSTDPVTFFGLPVVMMSYASSVIPIIIAVWLQSYLEKFLNKYLPSTIRNFTTPMVVLVLMVPLTLLTVGPLTINASNAISGGVNTLFHVVPWLAGLIMGGGWQILVIFGLHWGFVPLLISDVNTTHQSLLFGPLLPAVLAQAGATLAVALRSRSLNRREIAGPAAFSGFLAGITEPAIYGVNLPLKKPFYFGVLGGAVGGAIAAVGGGGATSMIFPSLLGIPGYLGVGSFALEMIGTGIAVAIGFTLTFMFGPREEVDADETESDTVAGVPGAVVEVSAPVSGEVIAMTNVNDKVFASEAMGKGLAIVPDSGTFVSPVDGTIAVAFKTGHAYGIKSADGVEVLVHIGLDTVNMAGDGFEAAVIKGQAVSKGDVLAVVDLAKIQAAGYDTTTVIVVTNTNKLADVTPTASGHVSVGSPIISISL
jgi:PTS system beta-glucosides-specific IIC component